MRICFFLIFRESASCTHVFWLLQALVALALSKNSLPSSSGSPSTDDCPDEALPITSFTCQWNVPRNRKESNAKISDVAFKKHICGRQVKHYLQPLKDYDPRPIEHRNTAQEQLKGFLSKVKEKVLVFLFCLIKNVVCGKLLIQMWCYLKVSRNYHLRMTLLKDKL